MTIIANTLGILIALIIGIFLGSKTAAKYAITETAKKIVDKLKNNKAIIISPSQVFKRNQLKKELSKDNL